ncbi:TerB family tellurite resistance protein [Autumnicola edwardsiae]|jgi:DnaJ like chaperone protein|uniref:TerB family tellurite resistance protein n=1 Tax=Autumnicola edwardsiae TaxID=3075594 RepID=A0ABU3CUK2_9FLAO|nr:TerB family tellurite resistance protein [Zunongwangia sp. F297]MDT0650040.1 TerB family tellurite resistance protein [Zunongwangia sp. F297]
MIKWFAALLGFMYFRFAGAILGFILGTVLDNYIRSSGGLLDGLFGEQKKKTVSPGDFELNLLSLCALVIKADGQVSQRELDYVRSYFVSSYGKERANATFRTFNDVIKNRELSSYRIAQYLAHRTKYPTRLQITHFLFGIAQADGTVSEAETRIIQEIAGYLRISKMDFESIKAMFFKKTAESAYKILEIDKSATDAEVKKAFRTMAKKYHPDKLGHMDEAYRKGAEEKFRKVQEAYEQIQKERGM